MKTRLLSILSRYPVFTLRNIADAMGKRPNYAYLAAYRLKKSGAIHEIEKGKYTMEDDPFIVASWITWPSYISGWAALSYYKLTEQLPFTIHVITTRRRKAKAISYGNARIEFIKVRAASFFGYSRIPYLGFEIFMAEREKAIVDAIAFRKMTLEEAIETIRGNRGRISMARLLSYSKISRGLAARLRGAVL